MYESAYIYLSISYVYITLSPDGMTPMTKTKHVLGDHGMTFNNMFVTTPLCCPSRSSLLTGRYAHNTDVVNNSIAGGCSGPSWQKGLEAKSSLSVLLKKLNYTTFYAGKYLNQYGKGDAGGVEHVPPGWDWWNGLVGNSKYYNYSLSVNGTLEKHGDKYEDDYLTDVIGKKADKFLSSWFRSTKAPGPSKEAPFFMMLSVPAPHAPFLPAPQYRDSFANVSAQRLPSFGFYGKDKHWLLKQARSPLSNESLSYINGTFRRRWETLRSVDDLVRNVAVKLSLYGVMGDTYVLFTSDNGYHLGQFSLPNDKRQLYEFDVRVPLIVRGPGVKEKARSDDLVMNIDIAPTIIDLAGGEIPKDMDGISVKKSLLGSKPGSGDEAVRDSFTIEHNGETNIGIPDHCPQKKLGGVGECKIDCVCEDAANNTYVCIRTLNDQKNDVYCKFLDTDSFEEQYNLKDDPYQLKNIAPLLTDGERNLYSKKLIHGALCAGQICRNMNDKLVESYYLGKFH